MIHFSSKGMNMKYPQLVNTLLYKKLNNGKFIVRNYETDSDYILDSESCGFIQHLDGRTDPYSIPTSLSYDEVNRLMRWLKKKELTRTSRFQKNGLLSVTFTLFKIKASINMKVISWFLNCGLMIFFLPLLTSGIIIISKNFSSVVYNYNYLLFIIGIFVGQVVGMILHESGHAISGLAFNAKVSECGLLFGICVLGAYVKLEESYIKSRLKRVQILAAGVEMNFAISGTALILSYIFNSLFSIFFGIAVSNLLLGLINLLPIVGLDGGQIINQLLGGDFLDATIDFILDKGTRKALVNEGTSGIVKACVCSIALISQTAYPLLMLVNIIAIGGLFK